MADPAKANSQQSPRRKKTTSRGKQRGARTHKPSARRKRSKSSQIDLFDEETKTSEKEATKKVPPKPIAAAPESSTESRSESVAAEKTSPKPNETVISQPPPSTPSEVRREASREAAKEIVSAPSSQNLARFSSSSPEVGPRRLLRSQQQRAARLRRILFISSAALLVLMISLAVFLLLRGRTRTDVKPLTHAATSENSPPSEVFEVAQAPSEDFTDEDLATAMDTPSAPSVDENEPEQLDTPTGVADSKKHPDEPAIDAALPETGTASSTTETPTQIPASEQSYSPTVAESPHSTETQAMAESSPSVVAVDEETESPRSADAAESPHQPVEVAMVEKIAPPIATATPELTPETTTVPSKSESTEDARAIDFTSPWTNSFGMRFVPVENVLFSVWETRVKDFEAFCEAVGRKRDRAPFEESGDHPVSRMNWNDAQEFCAWLTEKERSDGIINSNQHYRLPTDREWSLAAGLEGEVGDTPEARDGQISKFYPWGSQWPPPNGAGNIADRSASSQLKSTVDNYTDGYVRSSPVGSFEANSLGIFDLSGNVWEWCQDPYGGKGSLRNWRVMRGGGWSTHRRKQLLSSYRSVVSPDSQGLGYGFRCVLAEESIEK